MSELGSPKLRIMPYPFQITSPEQYRDAYARSIADPQAFWAEVAGHFPWRRKWDTVLESDFRVPDVRWFAGARLNITEACLDRHLEVQPDVPAILFEPNNPDEAVRKISYRELHRDVCSFAEVLRRNGVKKGDRVCLYMGMIPELAVATLACARIGAIHSVIFGGFSARSIADRLDDAGAGYVVTCDEAYRGAKTIPLKAVVDEALDISAGSVQRVIVYRRSGGACPMQSGRDVYWEDELLVDAAAAAGIPAEEMEAESPLFILYTSGSTGKPKGVVHTTGGYMVYTTYTFVNVFQYIPGDVFFCTADVGWITGHSYIVYGPLCAGATVLLYEGIPTWPDAGRLWTIIDKHRVNILYTAPTAIRSLMTWGTEPLEGKDLSTLKVLGSVGEPINEEAWHWLDKHAGRHRCPIVDTWWQTETGGILISNLAGVTPGIPGYATLPLPGVQPLLMNDQATAGMEEEGHGNLCISAPWPSILRTTWGDHERCRSNYFSAYPGYYFTGDGALRDEAGNYRITGRVDDVLNVSGHRLGTAELENAINEHPGVIESAVVSYPHAVKGEGIWAYIVLAPDAAGDVTSGISITVTRIIGAHAKPDKIQVVSGLPKTRSGKIMRRILRKIASGEADSLGDISTLLDPGIVAEIAIEARRLTLD